MTGYLGAGRDPRHAFQGHEDAHHERDRAERGTEGGYTNAWTASGSHGSPDYGPEGSCRRALDILSELDDELHCPKKNTARNRKWIRRVRDGMDDPDRMIGQLMFRMAYQRHPYRLPVIGDIQVSDHHAPGCV